MAARRLNGVRQAAAQAVSRILNQEIKCAQADGLTVLYCIGEKSEEQADWENVLGAQLDIGLDGVDKSRVVIAYEPIWSIGPGKTPADNAVTIRERDSMEQVRVPISELKNWLAEHTKF